MYVEEAMLDNVSDMIGIGKGYEHLREEKRREVFGYGHDRIQCA